MLKYIFYTLLLIAPSLVNCQTRNAETALKMGDKEFSHMRYAYAIPFYKNYIELQDSSANVLAKLGDCYRFCGNIDSALFYYEKATTLGADTINLIPELYASAGKYEEAISKYKLILNNTKLDNVSNLSYYKTRMEGFIKRNRFYKDSLNYTLRYLNINTPFNEFGLTYYQGGLVFESNRTHHINSSSEFGWDGTAYTKLYYYLDLQSLKEDTIKSFDWYEKKVGKGFSDYTHLSSNDNDLVAKQYGYKPVKYQSVEVPLFDKSLDKKINYGSASFTSDGNTVYLTRNQNKSKGIKKLEIWQINKVNDLWSDAVKLHFNKNVSSYFHPAITADGKRLYFVSDQPGGFGGTDIYYVDKKNDGTWGDVTNAGAVINTGGNELFPSFSEGNLYISSNGHAGLGGLDMYRVVNYESNPTVENLGYPINSSKDDISFIINSSKGFVSSNRYGNDDIFSFEYKKIPIEGNGTVTVNHQRLSNITVSSTSRNSKGELVEFKTQTIDGNYTLPLNEDAHYNLSTEFAVGHVGTATFTADKLKYNKSAKIYQQNLPDIDISVPVEGFGVVMINHQPKSGIEVGLIDKETGKQIATTITDINGNYILPIISGKQYQFVANGGKGLKADVSFKAGNGRFNSTKLSFLEEIPKMNIYWPDNFIEQMILTSDKYFIVYHHFDKLNTRKEDAAIVNEAVTYLNDHSSNSLLIVSAADCSGKETYNQNLSKRRAETLAKVVKTRIGNKIDVKYLGSKNLIIPCDPPPLYKINIQFKNRYSYLFIR